MAQLDDSRLLLFGGIDNTGPRDDTWIYDTAAAPPQQWTPVATAGAKPSARSGHAMARLGALRVALFGGTNGAGETWVFDGTTNTWTQQQLRTSPPPRRGHAMATLGGRALLFGGFDSSAYQDTWIFQPGTGGGWEEVTTSASPLPRSQHAMAWIGGTKAVLFGGLDPAGTVDDETWIFDAGSNPTWTGPLMPSPRPSARRAHAMAFFGDARVLLFGGMRANNTRSDETWRFVLASEMWVLTTAGPHPAARLDHALGDLGVSDTRPIVLFGGSGDVTLGDTWVYD